MNADEALSALVAGEDAAVYAYGVIAARVSSATRPRAVSVLDVHRGRSIRWRSIATAADVTAPPAAAAYDLPFEVGTDADARRLAVHVERRLAALYAQASSTLVDREQRTEAILGARECATRAVAWGGTPQAFPGS